MLRLYTDASVINKRMGLGVTAIHNRYALGYSAKVRGRDHMDSTLGEILAVSLALSLYERKACPVTILSDSTEALGHIISNVYPVPNKEKRSKKKKKYEIAKKKYSRYVDDIVEACQQRHERGFGEVTFQYVKGHSGVYGNELSHILAAEATMSHEDDTSKSLWLTDMRINYKMIEPVYLRSARLFHQGYPVE
jgi:ribonuclease HI